MLYVTSYRLKVKALNFHFNNVGSSPASLMLLHLSRLQSFFLTRSTKQVFSQRLVYSLKFVSLFTPGVLRNVRLYLRSKYQNGQIKFTKSTDSAILIKQSYVMLVWFVYLSLGYDFEKHEQEKLVVPGFFIYPKHVSKFTILKAPMAHKTYSQEQLCFGFYSFSVTFKANFDFYIPNKKFFIVFFYRYFSSVYFIGGTNLLFLKKFRIIFLMRDSSFFSYYSFLLG